MSTSAATVLYGKLESAALDRFHGKLNKPDDLVEVSLTTKTKLDPMRIDATLRMDFRIRRMREPFGANELLGESQIKLVEIVEVGKFPAAVSEAAETIMPIGIRDVLDSEVD